MKTKFLFPLIFSLTFIVFSQEPKENTTLLPVEIATQAEKSAAGYQSILPEEKITVGGFGTPLFSFSSINGEFASLIGGGGAISLNNFWIGLYGMGLVNQIDNDSGDQIIFGHGGFWFGYTFLPDFWVHPVLQLQIGAGGYTPYNGTSAWIQEKTFFVMVPSLEVEFNFTRFFRLGLSVNYRYVADSSLTITGKELSSWGGVLAFKFGYFTPLRQKNG